MPKNRDKKTGRNACSKFLTGSRKGGKSAVVSTTEELIKIVENPDKRKYHSNARHVLSQRGVNI